MGGLSHQYHQFSVHKFGAYSAETFIETYATTNSFESVVHIEVPPCEEGESDQLSASSEKHRLVTGEHSRKSQCRRFVGLAERGEHQFCYTLASWADCVPMI